MARIDPYTPTGERVYECSVCGTRRRCDRSRCRCPACGSPMQNIAVPRE